MKSILAGICIGLGCTIYCSVENHILGALLFSCGLLAIRLMKYDLFTGKVQYLITKQYNKTFYIFCLLNNLIGILIALLITSPQQSIVEVAASIGQIRLNQSFIIAIVKGIGCGALMTIATYKETPLWISSLCVVGFISAGFNHCIADWYYLWMTQSNIFKIIFKWFPILIGNIIGGLIIYPFFIKDEA